MKGAESDRTNLLHDVSDRFSQDLKKQKIAVFLCGPNMEKNVEDAISSEATARLHLFNKLTNDHVEVYLGEHEDFRASGQEMLGANFSDSINELSIAIHGQIDLIVILPSSPGSFGELGMFSPNDVISKKMLVLVDGKYKDTKSFINDGLIKLARMRKADIHYEDYNSLDKLWKIVKKKIDELRTLKLTSNYYA